MHLRRRPCLLVCLALAAASCGVAGSGGGSDGPKATTTVPAGPSGAKAVLAKLRGSVAFVETPTGTGSGVFVDGGYLVTNSHVVDPFDVADVAFDGDEPIEDVPVVGVDLDADAAVLGPIEGSHPTTTIEDPKGIEQGSTLYLVGYPGDQEEPEITITSGLLSRRRPAKEWGYEFLQSDAKIAPGQSGGALADEAGRVVGISGLADDDGYALTASGADAAAAVRAILDGKGSKGWEPAPHAGDRKDASFHVEGTSDYRLLYFPATDDDVTVAIGVDGPAPVVELDDAGLYPLALNQAALDLGSITGGGPEGEDLPDATAPGADGKLTFTLEAGYPSVLFVGTAKDEPATLEVTSSVAFAVVNGDPEPRAIEPSSKVISGDLGYFDVADEYELDLAAGDVVHIRASSATGDVAYTVVAPGETYDTSEEVDGGGGGLFDADAEGDFEADVDGTYRLDVYQVEGVSTGYHLEVSSAG
ncbi:serine protease [Aquihabitans sp. G128]|uniref:S1 family peptidase n=1 Tax=Aquihabitans sp. G128 TaxID=2849779 RepID=UPI001C231F0F|nr:serine protease [Aquihabitans sp. G128]QXC63038.1 serine protease [Aquihabitans sp. G128]